MCLKTQEQPTPNEHRPHSETSKVEGNMKKEGNVKILEKNIKQSAAKLCLGHRFVFQHDSNTNYTWLLLWAMKKHLQKAKVSITDWPAQSPDLNPAEHL